MGVLYAAGILPAQSAPYIYNLVIVPVYGSIATVYFCFLIPFYRIELNDGRTYEAWTLPSPTNELLMQDRSRNLSNLLSKKVHYRTERLSDVASAHSANSRWS
jgi:hypothetical protein